MSGENTTVVRHVGIARTILDRYDEIARGPSMAGSFGEAVSSVVGRNRNERADGEQLRLGEAGQIFSEVWANLDAAARALAGAGKPCAPFTAIRDTQPATPLGLTRSGDFNWDSARAAREAIGAIERATPDIDWIAIKRADQELEDAAAKALGRGRHKAIAVVGGILLTVVLGVLAIVYVVMRTHQF